MTNLTYFVNFYYALAASLSDDEFLAFAEAALANLKKESGTYAAEIALLEPLVLELRKRHDQQGERGKSAQAANLKSVVKAFLAYAKLTNTTKVFPAFPDRNQTERIDIFPGGMDALYRADQTNILSRATYYLDKITDTYGAKTGVPVSEATDWKKKIKDAVEGRTTETSDQRKASAAIDEQELRVCDGLYFAFTGTQRQHYLHPEQGHAYFPFPKSTGKPAEDDNLASLPFAHPAG
jgi:hypothetical protein